MCRACHVPFPGLLPWAGLFTLACAFNRCEIVRALVVEFSCALDARTNIANVEEGLVLIDEHENELEWRMAGLGLWIASTSLRGSLRRSVIALSLSDE